MSKKKRESMTDQLRNAVRDSGLSINHIAIGAGIPQPVLQRFISGERENIRLDTADRLAAYFGMRLTKACKPKE